MAKKRVNRRPLTIRDPGTVGHLAPNEGMSVRLDDGCVLDASWFSEVEHADELLRELCIFLRGMRSAKAQGNTVFRYLRFVANSADAVSARSLQRYREYLDREVTLSGNTKHQLFATAKGFVRHAMAAGTVEHDFLPRNFLTEPKKPKQGFADVCRYQIDELVTDQSNNIDALQREHSLSRSEAAGLVFSQTRMKAFRDHCIASTRRIIDDWIWVRSVVEALNEHDLIALRADDAFQNSKCKSIDLAISVIYARFGYALPSSTCWPAGVGDWCKQPAIGWSLSRIRGAFFPCVKSLDPFLGLMLADSELMPNVDSAAFYSYLDSFGAPDENELIDVRLGKFRGSGMAASLRSDSPCAYAGRELAWKVRTTLPHMPGGNEWLGKERTPLMLHFTPSGGCDARVRTVDPSTTANMVRRLMREGAAANSLLDPLVGKITGENFRPTHAFIGALSGENASSISQRLGHRHFSTTVGYIDRLETQAGLNREHQRFQIYLIGEAENSRRTGSGYVCGANPQDGCVSYSECHCCAAKRIVLSSPELAAEWLAWEEEIAAQQPTLETNNPARWVEHWLPKLIEYRALISMATEKTLREAREIVPSVVVPCLE